LSACSVSEFVRKVAVGGKRVLGNNGEEGEEVANGKSDEEKRGEANGERLLCRCLAKRGSSSKEDPSRSEYFGLVIKWEESSFLRSDREGTPGGVCRSTCLVVGAIVKITPSRWAPECYTGRRLTGAVH
jgi:hypothetical protein